MTKLCNTCEYLKFCARSGIETVGCDRYKKDTTTNEEWFCSLPTEEKAEWLSNTFDLCGAGCRKCFVKELCFNEHINKMPSDLIVEWLKQPHRGGET